MPSISIPAALDLMSPAEQGRATEAAMLDLARTLASAGVPPSTLIPCIIAAAAALLAAGVRRGEENAAHEGAMRLFDLYYREGLKSRS